MGYSRDIYDAAVDELKKKHSLKLRVEAERRTGVAGANPRFAEIEAQLSTTSARMIDILLSKKGTDAVKRLRDENLALQRERRELLKSSGLPEDFLDPLYNCPKCCDELYIDGSVCDCLKKMMREKAYDKLNSVSPLKLTPTFKSFSLEHYTDIDDREYMGGILDRCKKYAGRMGKKCENLLFMGGTGLGKTHLSLAVARDAIEHGFGVIYDSAPSLFSRLDDERFGRGGDGLMQSVCDCDLLILDDLGTEHNTPSYRSHLYQVINSRLMSGKPTIINTNLELPDILRNYSDAIYSRLYGDYFPAYFIGSDMREIKRKRNIE